jgi:hypothetical protein
MTKAGLHDNGGEAGILQTLGTVPTVVLATASIMLLTVKRAASQRQRAILTTS